MVGEILRYLSGSSTRIDIRLTVPALSTARPPARPRAPAGARALAFGFLNGIGRDLLEIALWQDRAPQHIAGEIGFVIGIPDQIHRAFRRDDGQTFWCRRREVVIERDARLR